VLFERGMNIIAFIIETKEKKTIMKRTPLSAFILSFIMIISMFASSFAFAQTENKKGEREVYLHAFDETPSLNTSEIRHTVYMGEDTNIYLAVDNPNKGTYLDADDPYVLSVEEEARIKATEEAEKKPNFTEEDKKEYIDYEVKKAVQLARHSEPQYDMQGYTVKIYFDTKYFKFKDSKNPLDFKEPNKANGFDIVDGEEIKADTSLNPGYMTHRPSYKCDEDNREGYAAATVFLMGNGFFPNKTNANKDLWYNLCKLPLTPLQTGSTSVRIEYSMGTDDDLELFAKNVADEKLNFDANVKNDGVFYLNIEEAGRPTRPLATVPGGTYNDKVELQLYHTNTEDCEIWYSTNGEDPRNNTKDGVYKYIQNADVTKNEILTYDVNTTINARVYRPSDRKWSDLATFTYEFLPRAPYLFNTKEELIPNIYNEIWENGKTGYYVFATDNKDFSLGISAGNSIYYTFDDDLSSEYITRGENSFVGSDPETQWVLVDPNPSPRLSKIIDQSRTVRLVTVNKWGISDISVYHLGIKPASVTATPNSGLDVQQPITLRCATHDAKIYYTTNGDDPRKETRFEYTEPLYFDKDTVIKAVSYYDGQWSEVTSFWYIFSGNSKSGVSAVYPSGIYTGSVEVILYPDEPGGEIEISFDGGKTWTDYDGTISGDTTTVDEHIEFNARIKRPENTDDDLGDKFVYIIKPLAPVFSPESCEFTSADIVTVFSPESTNDNKDRFELWYTLDGTEPTGSLKAPENDIVNIPVTGYTKIKAVVVKDGEYMSETVEHIYNVVYDKPAKPTATLPSGYYTRQIGSDEFATMFAKAPKGVEIYYTIGDRNTPFDAPDLNTPDGAIKYVPGTQIAVTNDTMIKAIAVQTVNGNIVKSDVAVFDYIITPEAPVAPASSVVKEFPLIPVDAIAVELSNGERSIVEYKIGNETDGFETVSFCTDEVDSDGRVRFYIDTKTGNSYRDIDKSELICSTGRTNEFLSTVILEIKTILDGEESQTNAYAYIAGGDDTILTAPYADKQSGTYPESKTPFVVNLYSIYDDMDNISIEWKYDDDLQWNEYKNPITFETTDKIIYARVIDEEGNVSPSAGYIYTFNPPVPEITPDSGIYLKSAGEKSLITQSKDIAIENIGDYNIYYRLATDEAWSSVRGNNSVEYIIEKTMTVMAYTYSRETGRVSETVYRSYVVLGESSLGAVAIEWPFNQSRISAHKLGKGDYANGIRFIPKNNVYYQYEYTLTDEAGGGLPYESDIISYDENTAFVPTERLDEINITAWINGDRQNTEIKHTIDFVHLKVPETDLPEKTEYDKGTGYHIVNEYKNDPTIIVYYTLDNSDPTLESAGRKSFTLSDKGSAETLNKTTTVKTVYFSACGKPDCSACGRGNYKVCPDYVYGEIGQYKYPVPTKTTVNVGGGGGGGSVTIDKTRKYTVDIFGNEHPTHIGYINGYPDGSVRPEGNITREEAAAILYRIQNHEYEKPFATTGTVFTDVDLNLWAVSEIEYMADRDVIYGYTDGSFKPKNYITRAEFAALIYRFAGIKSARTENPFSDLSEDHWAYSEIVSLAQSGLIEGYPDGTFGSENYITRAEAMTIINKFLGRKPLESYVKSLDFNPFEDLYQNKWYYVTVLEATITHNYYLDKSGYEYIWEDCK
jgi:hypothetical protein